jgi:hypothetical protein
MGRAHYYSTQEVFLLALLPKGGQRPNLVIFLDGLNECTWGNFAPTEEGTRRACGDVPQFTQEIAEAIHNLQFKRALSPLDQFGWLPILRLAEAISRWMASPPSPPSPDQTADDCKGTHMADAAVRYRQNVEMARAISKLYGISTLFFLQPDATVHYSAALYHNLRHQCHIINNNCIRRVKPEFYRMVRDVEGVIDLTNLFDLWGPSRKAVIDNTHYSPQFNLFLQHIANHIDLVSLASHSRKSATLASG